MELIELSSINNVSLVWVSSQNTSPYPIYIDFYRENSLKLIQLYPVKTKLAYSIKGFLPITDGRYYRSPGRRVRTDMSYLA